MHNLAVHRTCFSLVGEKRKIFFLQRWLFVLENIPFDLHLQLFEIRFKAKYLILACLYSDRTLYTGQVEIDTILKILKKQKRILLHTIKQFIAGVSVVGLFRTHLPGGPPQMACKEPKGGLRGSASHHTKYLRWILRWICDSFFYLHKSVANIFNNLRKLLNSGGAYLKF